MPTVKKEFRGTASRQIFIFFTFRTNDNDETRGLTINKTPLSLIGKREIVITIADNITISHLRAYLMAAKL